MCNSFPFSIYQDMLWTTSPLTDGEGALTIQVTAEVLHGLALVPDSGDAEGKLGWVR
jgi:hypothetical protein